MGAEFFSINPMPSRAGRHLGRLHMRLRVRQTHRWISVAFMLTVAANFVAMIWGQPSGWITYSPLPPLLLLLLTGVDMIVRHYALARRAAIPGRTEG